MRVGILTEEMFKCQNPWVYRIGTLVIHNDWCITPMTGALLPWGEPSHDWCITALEGGHSSDWCITALGGALP